MQIVINGLMLTVLGMGTVFAFLTIMVIATDISSKYASKLSHLLPDPQPAKPKRKAKAKAPAAAADEDDGVLLALVTGAIHRYRCEHGG